MVALALMGCDAPTTPPDPEPVTLPGVYSLATVNGYDLPAVIAVVPPEVTRLIAIRLHLNADGTFRDSTFMEFDATPFGGVARDTSVFTGTYALTDSTVAMARADGTGYVMRWRPNELERFVKRVGLTSAPLLDLTLVYRKH